MAKVLLVNPSLAYSTWSADLNKPSPDTVFTRLGLAYLSSALKSKGHKVSLADLRTLSGWNNYEQLIKEISPDFIGISIHSVEFSIAVEAAKIAKRILPHIKIVAGGIHPTMFPQECFDTGVFDYVLQGEGEISLPLLVEDYERFPKIFWGETPDLNNVPFPDRELWHDFRKRMYCEPFGISGFRFPLPMAEMINIRGCPYNCSFCCGPGEHQLYTKLSSSGTRTTNIRGRSVSNVIAELNWLVDRYSINSVMFHDDQFIMNPKWVDEFVDELHNTGLVKYGLKWVTSSRSDIICRNENLIGKMADAGLLLLIIGFESFSPRILKLFNKTVEVEQNFRAAEICRKYNIKIWANYILGVSTDTGWHKEDDILTVSGVLKVNPVHYSPAFYTPVPGSKLFTFYKENDLIDSDSASSIEDLSNRGKLAAKLKGVDYCFLENILIEDSILTTNINIKELTKNYSPEKNNTDDLEYIATKSIDAAACIIKVLHGKVNELTSKCAQLQSSLEQANNNICTSNNIINRMLNSAYEVRKLEFRSENNVIDSKISIVIPVYNGGNQIRELLAKIRDQKRVSDVEIIIIDSESDDDTVQISRGFDVKVIEIPKGEFNHGATRQIGVSEATGRFIILTVQDAYPADDYWLYKMVKCLIDNPELAVVSTKQMANYQSDLYSRWVHEVTYKSYGFQEDIQYFLKDTDSFYYLPENIRRSASFVDNVCACYRADVLKKHGFRKISIAEDIDIGVRMAQAGLRLGFLNSTGVYHWHSNGPDYYLKRHFNGVISFVEILRNELPNFALLKVDCFESICLKSAVMYHTLRLTLEEWRTNEILTRSDLETFVKTANSMIRNFPQMYNKIDKNASGNQALNKLLDDLNCRLSESDLKKDLFTDNLLAFKIFEQLENFIKYTLENINSLKLNKIDFSDVVFKIAASSMGNLIGGWVMRLKKDGRHEEIKYIENMLTKGVCHS